MEQISLFNEKEVLVSNKAEKNLIAEVREKTAKYGVETTSDMELLMLLVNDIEKANAIVENGITSLEEMTIHELKSILTETKIIQIKAALELGKRIRTFKKDETKISQPKDAADLLMDEMRYLKQEVLTVLYLNTKNVVIGKEIVFKGTLNSSIVHPREIFSSAIKRSAASIIVSHNHPSGDPAPSSEDINITNRLKEAGKILGVEMLDHVIIGNGRYVSLKEKGII